MTVVAFTGLGVMGAPMAENLLKAGFDVVGYGRRAETAERILAAGGCSASTVAEAVEGADVAITMLPDSPQVEEVALGPHGVLDHANNGLIYIDSSTISPEVS